MESIEPLIPFSELRHSLISEAANRKVPPVSNYDESIDTMTLMFVQPTGQTFVYYMDADLALICDMETLEIMGFQIEGFAKEYVPKQANRNLAQAHAPWRMPVPA